MGVDKGIFFPMQKQRRHATLTRRVRDGVEGVDIELSPLKNILAYSLDNIPTHKSWYELGHALGGNFFD